MELTQRRTVQIMAGLLFLAALTQPVYTALYKYAPEVDRLFIWQSEALIFVLLIAFAGAALVVSRRYALGFAAIAFSAVLNLIQVGIGLTQFKPFGAAAAEDPEMAGLRFAIVALSFFLYNAAKLLLGLAAIVFGMAKFKQSGGIGQALGGLTALVGLAAVIFNALVMMLGLKGAVPSHFAGGSGVAAALLLALCLFALNRKDALGE